MGGNASAKPAFRRGHRGKLEQQDLPRVTGQMNQVRRVRQEKTLSERLAEAAREARKQAQLLPDGQLRDVLLEKARQYEAQIPLNVVWDNNE